MHVSEPGKRSDESFGGGRWEVLGDLEANDKIESSVETERPRESRWWKLLGRTSTSERSTHDPSTPTTSVTPCATNTASHSPVPQPMSITLRGWTISTTSGTTASADRREPDCHAFNAWTYGRRLRNGGFIAI
jgi:hypothetical protein